MNVLQGVILTAMRLATLIWLTGAVCCMPVLAADPQHKEQSAAETVCYTHLTLPTT